MADIDVDKLFEKGIQEAIYDGVKQRMGQYNSPLDKILQDAIVKHQTKLTTLLEEAIASCVDDPQFREDVKASTRQTLAKLLVQRFGGELEKQVNNLKSDPTTRARIVMAIDEIVKSKVG